MLNLAFHSDYVDWKWWCNVTPWLGELATNKIMRCSTKLYDFMSMDWDLPFLMGPQIKLLSFAFRFEDGLCSDNQKDCVITDSLTGFTPSHQFTITELPGLDWGLRNSWIITEIRGVYSDLKTTAWLQYSLDLLRLSLKGRVFREFSGLGWSLHQVFPTQNPRSGLTIVGLYGHRSGWNVLIYS